MKTESKLVAMDMEIKKSLQTGTAVRKNLLICCFSLCSLKIVLFMILSDRFNNPLKKEKGGSAARK